MLHALIILVRFMVLKVKQTASQAIFAQKVAPISNSLAVSQTPAHDTSVDGHGASVWHGVPVYSPVTAGTN